jgi:hypothetical protein
MDRKPFLLRIDPKLWAELEAWAQDELRSVNGQVEYLLRQAVQKRKGVKDKAIRTRLSCPRLSHDGLAGARDGRQCKGSCALVDD